MYKISALINHLLTYFLNVSKKQTRIKSFPKQFNEKFDIQYIFSLLKQES